MLQVLHHLQFLTRATLLVKSEGPLFPLSHLHDNRNILIPTKNLSTEGERALIINKRPQAQAQTHLSKKAIVSISHFRHLHRKGPRSIDSFTLLRALSTSSTFRGKQIHALIIHLGMQSNVFLQSSLISMYSSMGCVADARKVFDGIPERNVVCWTALISAYASNNKPRKALETFRKMQFEGVEPDSVTVTTMLSACADLGALNVGEWIHDYLYRKKGFQGDIILCNALINMYAKCGDVDTCLHLFRGADKRDVTTWTSVIMGLALHGRANQALALFAEMQKGHNENQGSCFRVVPNKVTFLGVLLACSHAGLVEEGRRFFKSMMMHYRLKPGISHFGCMVDLLCRAGLVDEALEFIERMPIQPSAVIWRTLLGACSLHGNVCIAARARQRLLELEPGYAGDDVIMSNTFAAAELWDEKENIRRGMKKRRIPGSSMIEVENSVH